MRTVRLCQLDEDLRGPSAASICWNPARCAVIASLSASLDKLDKSERHGRSSLSQTPEITFPELLTRTVISGSPSGSGRPTLGVASVTDNLVISLPPVSGLLGKPTKVKPRCCSTAELGITSCTFKFTFPHT